MSTHKFFEYLSSSLNNNTFVRLSLGNYKGTEPELKKIIIDRITIKKGERLHFTYRYQTRDVVKNYPINEGIQLVQDQMGYKKFRALGLFTIEGDYFLDCKKNSEAVLRTAKASHRQLPETSHDKQKKRLIETKANSYLHHLGITDTNGKVYKNGQDKYRQINRFVELLRPLLDKLPTAKTRKIVDMGSGKGYLTFALYDYLVNQQKQDTLMTGVEYRQALVDTCNEVAQKSNFGGLHFVQGSIVDYSADDFQVLIALHACDTATDEAIFKGINAGSELIVVAPCCHKQIRREIEAAKSQNELDFLLRHGIFLERQAEMVTDGIRALILEYYGYSTKVFEFISDAHTPKNVLVVGIKNKSKQLKDSAILEKINTTKKYFGIEKHHLEKLLKINYTPRGHRR